MKTIRILAAFAMVLMAGSFGCKPFDLKMDDINVSIDLDIIKTNIGIQLIDATTEVPFNEAKGVTASITIHGENRELVLDPSGSRYESFSTNSGYVGLALDPYLKKPTEDNPVKFTAVIDVDGYVATSLPVVITREGEHELIVKLVEVLNPPVGVTITEQKSIDNVTNGIINEDIEIRTSSDEVVVKIDSGTILKDADGQALEGALDVVLAYFDPMEEEALDVFPGGMDVTVTNEEGQPEDVSFISAGFIAFEIMDASGKLASDFDVNDLKLDIKIPDGLVNPETGSEIKAGDQIPLWSYETIDGEWTWEGKVTVGGFPGKLKASMNIPHLSYWNLDWKGTNCDNKYLIFSGDPAITEGTRYVIKARRLNGGGYLYNDYENLYPGQRIRMVNIPYVQIEVFFQPSYSYCGTTPQWQQPASFIWDFCENGDYTVQLTANSIQTVEVKVIIHCLDTGQDIIPSQSIKGRFRKQGTDCWTEMWISSGSRSIPGIEPNTTYEVQAYYQGVWQPQSPFEQYIGNETSVIFRPEINCN